MERKTDRRDGSNDDPVDIEAQSQSDTDTARQASASGELFVEESVSDLPTRPETPSFAVTTEGILRHSQDGDGWQPIQYGSETTPVPQIDARGVSAGVSGSSRPLISNGDRTVYADPENGDDAASGSEDAPVATIQEAVRRAPLYLRDRFVVDLATAADLPVSYDEDVLVPSTVATGQAGQEAEAPEPGPFINLVIKGKQGEAGAVDIGSLMFGNVLGTAAGNLYHSTVSRDSPYDDEGYGLSAYGNGEVKLYNVEFTDGPTNGVLTYGARMKATQIDFGDGNLAIGVKAKRHASIIMHDCTGSLNRDGFRATGNSTISIVRNNSVSGSPLFNTLRGGLIYNVNADAWVGLSGNADVRSNAAHREASEFSVRTHTTHPEDVSPGEIWYIDGAGEAEEGFYGQTEDGPQRIG
jgi:hypothetical protein